MGLYGSGYLGWQLRLSDDTAVVTKARQLHPRLALGMTAFFALGATGGITSLIMQDKPIFARCALSGKAAWTVAGSALCWPLLMGAQAACWASQGSFLFTSML